MSEALRVFVSGPYSASTQKEIDRNISIAVRMGCDVAHAGHFPVVPHAHGGMIDFAHKHYYGAELSYDYWIAWCLAELATCDVVLCYAQSPGADVEVAHARTLGIPVVGLVDDLAGIRKRDGGLRNGRVA
jgi:hypothetical protein